MDQADKPIKLIRRTYLNIIQKSVGTKMFRNFFIEEEGTEKDAIENGKLSCAFFVSGILTMFGFIKAIHGTVKSTVEDLEESGWAKSDKPNPGDVLVWEKKDFGEGDLHKHIGFYIGQDRAVSNDYEKGVPEEHDWTFSSSRKIEAIYRLSREID